MHLNQWKLLFFYSLMESSHQGPVMHSLLCLCCLSEHVVEQTIKTLAIWVVTSMWCVVMKQRFEMVWLIENKTLYKQYMVQCVFLHCWVWMWSPLCMICWEPGARPHTEVVYKTTVIAVYNGKSLIQCLVAWDHWIAMKQTRLKLVFIKIIYLFNCETQWVNVGNAYFCNLEWYFVSCEFSRNILSKQKDVLLRLRLRFSRL